VVLGTSAYDSLIRPLYSSDPFPLSSLASPSPVSGVDTLQRETRVLDFFIALKIHEDIMVDDSSLHLEQGDSFKDLFNFIQPRSRLEDLQYLSSPKLCGDCMIPSSGW
jgi:hypothetical protein